jgi:glutaredoxin
MFSVSFAETTEAVLYYGNGCPHCSKVSKYIEEKNLDISLTKKEIYQNTDNAKEFNEVCESHEIGLYKRGVPFLYIEDRCLIGSSKIISYLEKREAKTTDEIKIDATNNKMMLREIFFLSKVNLLLNRW